MFPSTSLSLSIGTFIFLGRIPRSWINGSKGFVSILTDVARLLPQMAAELHMYQSGLFSIFLPALESTARFSYVSQSSGCNVLLLL